MRKMFFVRGIPLHWIETIDSQTAAFAHGVQIAAGSFMTPFLRIVSILGNGGAVFLAAAAVLLLFRQTRKTGTAALIALLSGVILTNLILKNAVARERPFSDPTSVYYTYWMETGSMAASGYSFPSGHTIAAMDDDRPKPRRGKDFEMQRTAKKPSPFRAVAFVILKEVFAIVCYRTRKRQFLSVLDSPKNGFSNSCSKSGGKSKK